MVDWKKVEEGVEKAGQMAADQRTSWLQGFCGGDDDLKREIESLLGFEQTAGGFLEQKVSGFVAGMFANGHNTESDRVGDLIGPYKVIRRIAHGGMGSVYLGVRADKEFNKRVAIKVLRRGMDTDDVLRRFRQERQILAALDHPYIARLFDGGAAVDGLPYFAMEYVEGEPLDRYVIEHDLPTDERIRLFIKVCSAVAYAHQNLVVHRDLKPSNILISAEGEPKLLDFGIAKFLNPELSMQTIAQTATYARLMTPEYASPEQIRGKNVTTASDVYSLGVVLYKILTGQNPHKFDSSSPSEIERVICESVPSRPSEAVRSTTAGGSRGAPDPAARRLVELKLRGDLDNIVLMALRKEPERRYRSVADLAEDLERHLDGRPVSARPNTFRYRAGKFISRNRVGVAAAIVTVSAVLAALGISLWQTQIAREQRDIARAEKIKAERVAQFLSAALTYSDPSASSFGTSNRRDATINQMLDDIAPRIEADLADQPDVRATLQRVVGNAYLSQLRVDDAHRYLTSALAADLELRGENHIETAMTLTGLGLVQGTRGDYLGGAETTERALSIFQTMQPTDALALKTWVQALNNLGYFRWTIGSYAASEKAHREALDRSAALGRGNEMTANSLAGLGAALYAKGELAEAVSLLQQAITEYRAMPHLRWRLPDALNTLAQVQTWRGNYDEAITALGESEAISREVLGDESAPLARSLYLQVYALAFKGDLAAAETVLGRCETIYQKIMPENKVSIANNLDARNIIYTRTGRLMEGETAGRRSVDLYSGSMNRGAASITLARIHLAENLVAQQKLAEAESILMEAYKDASEVQGQQHWRTRNAADLLAVVYEKLGRDADAQRFQALGGSESPSRP